MKRSIAIEFREESSLVDTFTLEILVVYLESLAMAHNDDKSLGKLVALFDQFMCSYGDDSASL